MGYTQFLAWVAKQGLKNKVLQKYLNKAWQEASKAGKPIIEKNFPALLKKAQDFKTNFKAFEPKVVPKEIVKPKLQIEKSKQIIEGMKSKGPQVVSIGDRIIKQMQKEGKTVKFDDLVRIYGKKPPNLKAEGGIAQLLGESGPVYSAEDINRRLKTLQEVRQGIDPSSYLYLRDELVKDALASGLISEEDYFNKWQKPFFGERGEQWTDAIDSYEKRNFNEGGLAGMLGETRSGYQGGGYLDYWKMVQDNFYSSEVGGEEGTGMTIHEFADIYFPRKAEGGRIGLAGGGDPRSLLLAWLIKQGPKAWKWINKPGNNPVDLYKKYLKSVKDRSIKGDYTKLGPELGILAGSGIMANRWAKKKLKEGMSEEEKKRKWWERGPGAYYPEKAQGGRIGLAEGDTPSQAWMRDYFYDAGYDDQGVITLDEYMNGPIGKTDYANHGPGKAKGGRIGYDNGGPVTQEEYDEYVAEKEAAGEEAMDFETYKLFKIQFPMAAGGRIGFKEGEGIMSRVGDMVDMRNIPYYSGKALQGLVNSAETLSKFPFAAGELGSKLIQQPPEKEMFMKAIEDITPGSWSENVGLTSLIEDMEKTRPEDAKTVGGILGLGTEIAVPTGGAFKGGQILLDKASKAMGKVKDGKTLNKLVEDKISDSGQSRRDFMSLVGASGLAAGLKWLGLGGLLKGATKVPTTDFTVKLRTQFLNSDVDYGTSGLAYFDISALTPKVKKVLHGFMKNKQATKPGLKGKDYMKIEPGDAKKVIKKLQDAGFNGKIIGIVDESGDVLQQAEKAGWKNFVDDFKKSSMRKNIAEHKRYEDFVVYENDPGFINWRKNTKGKYDKPMVSTIDEVVDLLEPVTKKAEGGRIGLDAGGPPINPSSTVPPYSTNDPEEAAKEIARRSIEKIVEPAKVPIDKDIQLMFDLNRAKIGGTKDLFGGEIDFGINKGFGRDDLGYGFNWSKKFSDGGSVLQRPMFYQGGLTKTVPPKKGPMPQGLQSDVYDGIMRPGVINGRN